MIGFHGFNVSGLMLWHHHCSMIAIVWLASMGSETAICSVVQTNLKQGCCGFESAILAGLTVGAGSFVKSHWFYYVMMGYTGLKRAYTNFFGSDKRF